MPVLRPRPLPRVLLLGLVPVAAWFVVRPLLEPLPSIPALYSSIGFSIFAFLATIYLVPALGPTFIKARLSGRDLLKVYGSEIPKEETLVCATVRKLALTEVNLISITDPKALDLSALQSILSH